MQRLALVLTGGGARAAYQAGAMRALAEIAGPGPLPFSIVAGVSAGAINAVALATHAHDFAEGAGRLWDTWAKLEPERVFRADAPRLLRLGTRWMTALTAGAVLGPARVNYLLDTEPLRELLQDDLRIERIRQHVRAGLLHGVALSVTSYVSGTAVTFFDGAPELTPWVRSTGMGVRATLALEHVLASAAIPILFAPVRVGDGFYGDGGIRLATPLSPAIHLGADRVLAVGVRYVRSNEETIAINRGTTKESITLSEIAGIVLNSVFLDSLDADVERMQRINRTLALVPPGAVGVELRRIPVLALRPSQDLGKLASDRYSQFPAMLRFLLRGIGATGETGADLLSYLAFEPGYISRLLDLGYRDTIAREAELNMLLTNR